MSRYPGFSYDAATGIAHFDCYVPGTAGKRRRRKTLHAVSRKEALDAWHAFVAALVTDRDDPSSRLTPVGAPVTLASFVATHFDVIAAGYKPGTRKSHLTILQNQLLPALGQMQLAAITAVVVQDFVVRLRTEGYAASYINGCVRVLKTLLHQAVERDVLNSYPIRKRIRREREALLRLELSDAERAALLQAFDDRDAFMAQIAAERSPRTPIASPHFEVPRSFGGTTRPDSAAADAQYAHFRWLKPLFVVALETGLRKGDLLALRWDAIDLEKGWMRVRMAKTGFEAVIPLSWACRDALAVCRCRTVVSALVLTDEHGHALSTTRLKRTFARAKMLAGVTRRFRFHDLRHTFASRLVSRGVGLKVVATALGHTTTQMTERYAKPSEDAMREISRALNMLER